MCGDKERPGNTKLREKKLASRKQEAESRAYPDFIRESQAAYQASGDPALGRMLAKKQGEYTIEDYYALPRECRVELIDGYIYNMSAPDNIHQSIAFEMGYYLKDYIKRKNGKCMTFIAPADVQLDMDDKTMVEPDLYVVCNRDKILKKALYGAPDFVAEVLSPSNTRKEQALKYQKYKAAGVREYWVVDPDRKKVTVHGFEHGKEPVIRTFQDKIPVNIFDGELEIDFKAIYEAVEFLYGE